MTPPDDPNHSAAARSTEADFPEVSGAWKMTIHWEWKRKHGIIEADAVISQHGQSLSMAVHAPRSDSNTLLALPDRDAAGAPLLYYMFEVEPKAGASDDEEPYRGAAILRFYEHKDELSGNYWTNKLSRGHYRLSRITEESPMGSTAPRSPPHRKRMPFWGWASAIVFIPIFLLIAYILIRPSPVPEPTDPWERKINVAVDQASKACLLNVSTSEKRQIRTELTARLRGVGGEGASTVETTRKSVNDTFSEAGQLAEDRSLRDCVARQIDKFLQYSPAAVAKEAAAQDHPAAGGRGGPSGAATGFVYYEENHGALTDDGVFGPVDGSSAPAYSQLHRGMVLKSVEGAILRSKENGRGQVVRRLGAGQCVQLLEMPYLPHPDLTSATSGGRIKVQAIACPPQQ